MIRFTYLYLLKKLGTVLLAVGAVHYAVCLFAAVLVDLNGFVLSYLTNFIMAIIALSILYKFRISHTASLGYIFLFTTLVKMIIYSLLIKPRIIVLFSDNKQAFYIFFIPYFTALIVEVFLLIKLLNRQ